MKTTLDRAPTLEDFCNAANDLYAAPTEDRFYAVVNLARESLILRGQAWDEGFAFGTSQFEPMPVAWMTFGACTSEPVFSTTPPDDDNLAGWVPVYRRMVPNEQGQRRRQASAAPDCCTSAVATENKK